MHDTLTRVSGYFADGVKDYDTVLDVARVSLNDVDYDTLVGTGLSGALVIPRLAHDLDKHWAIVRKPDDSAHACYQVEGTLGKRWLFVDDCIESGKTWVRVREEISKHVEEYGIYTDFTTRYIGAYTYSFNVGFHPVGSLDMEGYWESL